MWSTPRQTGTDSVCTSAIVPGPAEVQALQALGDDDGKAPIGGEVEVVRVLDRDRAARPAGPRVDRGERVAQVVVDVERLEVPGRRDVLGQRAGRELRDDLHRALADHRDRVAHAVGDVDQRGIALDLGAEHAGGVGAVDVDRLPRIGRGVDGRRTQRGWRSGRSWWCGDPGIAWRAGAAAAARGDDESDEQDDGDGHAARDDATGHGASVSGQLAKSRLCSR